MLRLVRALFSSPESLLQVMSSDEIEESIEEGARIIINEDGGAMVNTGSPAVREDFERHVNALKRA